MKKLALLVIVGFLLLYVFGSVIGLTPLHVLLFLFIPFLIFSIAFFYWFRNIYFFREPKRIVPTGNNIIVSPADGRVMYIYKVENGKVISNKNGEEIFISEIAKSEVENKKGWLIGAYMSPFDVHYNYAPISGKVDFIYHHQTGLNLPMVDLWEYINFTLLRRSINLFARKFHLENERMTIKFTNSSLSCHLILIADKFVNKITPYFKLNDEIEMGKKISFIERGSQADLFIQCENVEFKVKVGQQIYGCKTIIAEYNS